MLGAHAATAHGGSGKNGLGLGSCARLSSCHGGVVRAEIEGDGREPLHLHAARRHEAFDTISRITEPPLPIEPVLGGPRGSSWDRTSSADQELIARGG